jgi:hypothetical protein
MYEYRSKVQDSKEKYWKEFLQQYLLKETNEYNYNSVENNIESAWKLFEESFDEKSFCRKLDQNRNPRRRIMDF